MLRLPLGSAAASWDGTRMESARANDAHRTRGVVRIIPCRHRVGSKGSRIPVLSAMPANPLDVFRDDALAGHVAVITGGGTGICRGIARAFARFGGKVCIVSRKADVLERAAAELGAEVGRPRDVMAVAADVR